MSPAASVERASSVILLREAQPHGFEVLLRQCLGGTHGFPCGAVQKSDYVPGILRRCRGLSGETARRILGAHFSPSQALGFWIAAARVLFEQAGILLAVKESGEPIAPEAELDARLRAQRAALVERRFGFRSILESENLFCDAATVRYFSHWRAESPGPGDLRMFLAPMPENHPPPTAVIGSGQWLAPDRALQLFNRGELMIAFSTFASLRTLADFEDVKSLLKECQRG